MTSERNPMPVHWESDEDIVALMGRIAKGEAGDVVVHALDFDDSISEMRPVDGGMSYRSSRFGRKTCSFEEFESRFREGDLVIAGGEGEKRYDDWDAEETSFWNLRSGNKPYVEMAAAICEDRGRRLESEEVDLLHDEETIRLKDMVLRLAREPGYRLEDELPLMDVPSP